MTDRTEPEAALLTWLRTMDDKHITTGLLARAFMAGWSAGQETIKMQDSGS